MKQWFVLEATLLLVAVIIPISVQAGVFSSIFGVTESEASDEVYFTNVDSAQSVPLLKAAFHTDPNPAKGGGDIIVEDGALVPQNVSEDEEVNSRTANGEISVYVVREGDTLSQIAEMFDVSANTILWANDITKASLIQPGDTLVILPITGIRHVVKGGDTISTIAEKYDSDIEEILSYNQLASADGISVGNIVVVPNGVMAAPAASTNRNVAPVRTSGGSAVASGGGSADFTHPLPGAMKTQGIHGYNGVDLAAAAGTAIRAAAAGEVIVSKSGSWNGGYGNYVVIRHPNGTQTLYAHNSSNAVGVGARVAAGETIAYVGSTGRSTGAHLHFEVRGARNPF
jgi:LysM repeat protein